MLTFPNFLFFIFLNILVKISKNIFNSYKLIYNFTLKLDFEEGYTLWFNYTSRKDTRFLVNLLKVLRVGKTSELFRSPPLFFLLFLKKSHSIRRKEDLFPSSDGEEINFSSTTIFLWRSLETHVPLDQRLSTICRPSRSDFTTFYHFISIENLR